MNEHDVDVPKKKQRQRQRIVDQKEDFKFIPSMFNYVNFLSTPSELSKLLPELTIKQKNDIEEIGFGALLSLKLKELDKRLYPLLTSMYDSMIMKVHDGLIIHADSHFFYEVLALPCKNEKIYKRGRQICHGKRVINNNFTKDEVKTIHNTWREKLNLIEERKFLAAGSLVRRLKEEKEGGDFFKQLFVMFVLTVFLAPHSDKRLLLEVALALQDVKEIQNYYWCSFIASAIDNNIRTVKATIKQNKTAPGCVPFEPTKSHRYETKVGGCFPALLIGYIHSYVFGDHIPEKIPYINGWDDSMIKERVKREIISPYVRTAKLVMETRRYKAEHLDDSKKQTKDEEFIEFVVDEEEKTKQQIEQFAEDDIDYEFLLACRNISVVSQQLRIKINVIRDNARGQRSKEFFDFIQSIDKSLYRVQKKVRNYNQFHSVYTKINSGDEETDDETNDDVQKEDEESNINESEDNNGEQNDNLSTGNKETIVHDEEPNDNVDEQIDNRNSDAAAQEKESDAIENEKLEKDVSANEDNIVQEEKEIEAINGNGSKNKTAEGEQQKENEPQNMTQESHKLRT